jgi:hypothetical protein
MRAPSNTCRSFCVQPTSVGPWPLSTIGLPDVHLAYRKLSTDNDTIAASSPVAESYRRGTCDTPAASLATPLHYRDLPRCTKVERPMYVELLPFLDQWMFSMTPDELITA